MKIIRNIIAIALVSGSLAACSGSNSQDKSIGGSTDTTENTTDVGATSVGGLDSTKADTASKDSSEAEGNATPSARPNQ